VSKEQNRRHWISISLASWSPQDQEDPPWIGAGRELDGLEASRALTPLDEARREWLRSQRAAGAIADAGEPWRESVTLLAAE
jgi:hypothetical protein